MSALQQAASSRSTEYLSASFKSPMQLRYTALGIRLILWRTDACRNNGGAIVFCHFLIDGIDPWIIPAFIIMIHSSATVVWHEDLCNTAKTVPSDRNLGIRFPESRYRLKWNSGTVAPERRFRIARNTHYRNTAEFYFR